MKNETRILYNEVLTGDSTKVVLYFPPSMTASRPLGSLQNIIFGAGYESTAHCKTTVSPNVAIVIPEGVNLGTSAGKKIRIKYNYTIILKPNSSARTHFIFEHTNSVARRG